MMKSSILTPPAPPLPDKSLSSGMAESDVAADRNSGRSDQRRKAIVEAATAVFLEAGFAGTTLDKIIERSGGSRRTLYEHFGSKEGLFSAVLCRCCERVLSSVNEIDIYALPPREALTVIGETYLRAILEPVNLAIYRAAVGEVTRFPEVGDDFYRNGPGLGVRRLAEYLRNKTAEGVLRVQDAETCAAHFLGMIKSDLHQRAVFYPGFVAADADIQRHVAAAVDMLLAAITP